MKHCMWKCLLVCGLAFSPALAQHDANKPVAPAPAIDPAKEMEAWQKCMEPTEHHKRLAAQEGTWDATCRWFTGGPEGATIEEKGTMVNTLENNGLLLKSEFKTQMMGMPFTGTGYIAYDTNRKKHVGVWIDNMNPGILSHEGDCSADGKVTTTEGTYVDPMQRKVKQRMVNTMMSADAMKFEIFAATDGAPEVKVGEIQYTRAKASATKDAEKPVEQAGRAAEGGNRMELPGGLIVEDLVVGTGDECPRGAKVTIHYRGTLKDGTEFDSSYSRGQPATFPLANLIRGWQEGIPGMKIGGKRRLTIPYPMAYGEAGRPPKIPAKSDLIFDIEMLGFAK